MILADQLVPGILGNFAEQVVGENDLPADIRDRDDGRIIQGAAQTGVIVGNLRMTGLCFC